jgi:tetratricopeptide (TPR) repeat protein
MNKKQIVVIVVVLATMGYLYSLPVKGLIKSKTAEGHTNTTAAAAEQRPTTNVTAEVAASMAKIAIGPALAGQINELEGKLKNATGDADKLAIQKQLAKQWDDVNQPAPAAFYYQAIATKQNKFEDWLTAGSRFNDAYKFTQDTTVQPAYVAHAIECLKNATKQMPGNLDAKTGLGVAYVNQTSLGITDADGGSPMQNNINANLNLGMFAVKSHQYDKAVQRFKTVLAQKQDADAYFYIAESYKQLGLKKEAIDAYQKCRTLVPDAAFDQQIDEFIKELKK